MRGVLLESRRVCDGSFDDSEDDETEEKAYFVQYRPNLEGEYLMDPNGATAHDFSTGKGKHLTHDEIMNGDSKETKLALRGIFSGNRSLFILSGCDACRGDTPGNDPTILTFKNGMAVSPTHISIRNGGCYGMSGDWDLAGSMDGKNWIVLLRARGKNHLYGGIDNDNDEPLKIRDHVRQFQGFEARKEAVCDYLEQNHRHTWKLDSPSADFFTHFRITSVATYRSDVREHFCLHGVGLEIWGEVREVECGDEPRKMSLLESMS